MLLSNLSLFNSLSPKVLQELDQLTGESDFSPYSAGTVIQAPGNESAKLSFVIEGKIRVYKTNAAGKQYTVGILSGGSMFGESISFALGTHGTYLEVIEDAITCSVQTQAFEDLLLRYPELSVTILNELSSRLKERDELLEQIIRKDLRGKIVFLLSKLSRKFGAEADGYQRINLPLTHQELANMIGATREAVSLILRELASEGLVVTGRKSILVHIEKLSQDRM